MSLPDGFAFVAGRNTPTAIELVSASHTVLQDGGVSIRAVEDGYQAPQAVVDEYLAQHESFKVEHGGTPDPFSLAPPETHHGVWTESTVHLDERTLEISTPATEGAAVPVAASADQSGTSFETQTADEAPESEEPNGGASKAAWLEFAQTQEGWDEADADLTRDKLKDKYASK